MALDWLFRIGTVGIRRVGNFEKQFDLMERIIPSEILSQPSPSEQDSLKELLVRAAAALGIATAAELTDYFRLSKRAVKPLLDELVEEGLLIECETEGSERPTFLHPEAVLPRQVQARALVSPFDPLVWNRDRASWLFDFDYRIEIYTPKHKRVYGYYVLPFVLGDRLVGRCDLKTDRKAGVLRVLGVFAEDGVDEEKVAPELAAELAMLAKLVAVSSVEVEAKGELASAIRAELAN